MDQPIRNILIPVSLRGTSEKLVAHAARIARAFDSTLWLLHVLKTPGVVAGHRLPPELKEEQEKEIQTIHQALDALVVPLTRQNLKAHAYLLPGVEPVDLILEQARAVQADLIVMGSHGRSAFMEALLGDVPHDVLRRAPCPVLIVPLPMLLPDEGMPRDKKEESS